VQSLQSEELKTETRMAGTAPGHSRRLILRGLAWNSAFQVFLVGASFASMLVLVRLLGPAEYGRASVASGFLAIITCFNCSYFYDHALQLRGDEEPDWGLHWRVGFYIQLALGTICNLVAGSCWFFHSYRPAAPLLHVASIGLIISWPTNLRMTMLRREMNFPRLRILHGTAVITSAATAAILALTGAGAYALIISGNVIHSVPFGLDLLLVRRWRPPAGWWRWPDWAAHGHTLRFGGNLSTSALLTAARGMLEALILPGTLGYEAIGLLNRAQVLFTTTFGRVNAVVVETVYPLLPRSAGDPVQFARHGTLFVQVMLLVSIPGAVLVGLQGPQLSRLLYGQKWVAADPLIWPGTVFAWGVSLLLVFSSVLLAASRMRVWFAVSIFGAALSLPAMLAVILGTKTLAYVWGLAGGQMAALILAMILASPCLERDWMRRTLAPPVVASASAAAALLLTSRFDGGLQLIPGLCLHALVYGLVAGIVLRGLFAVQLKNVLTRLPAGERVVGFLGI
jgi:O-antigen/teichoic acid export membrane protein